MIAVAGTRVGASMQEEQLASEEAMDYEQEEGYIQSSHANTSTTTIVTTLLPTITALLPTALLRVTKLLQPPFITMQDH